MAIEEIVFEAVSNVADTADLLDALASAVGGEGLVDDAFIAEVVDGLDLADTIDELERFVDRLKQARGDRVDEKDETPDCRWPSAFAPGDIVRQRDDADGVPPPDRFKGVVCGSYRNPMTAEPGVTVASEVDPGCLRMFPDNALDKVAD